MASALRAEQSSRTWWSLSSKSSKQDLRKQYANDRSTPSAFKSSPTKGFPSFASVIGFKSKKHPTLAIQDPPSSLKPYPSPRPHPDIPPQFRTDYPTRNRLMSAPQQPLSPADSIEPLTPVDGFRPERQSLLTLSDADPFAPRSITLHTPSSPTRLSGHSASSFLDVGMGQDKSSLYVRASYSSSSSNSHSPRELQSQQGLLRPQNPTVDARTLSSSKSLSNLQKAAANHADPEPPLPRVPQTQMNTTNSRPPARSRGMTDVSYTRPPFLQETYAGTRARRPSSPGMPPSAPPHALLPPGSQPSSRPSSRPSSTAGSTTPNQQGSTPNGIKPQTVSRQASQRLQPPTAPPTHDLPAPPPPPPLKVTEESKLEDELDIPIACDSSVSSSSLSFTSSRSSGGAIPGLLDLQKRWERNKKSDVDKLSFVARLKINPEADIHPTISTSKSPSDAPVSTTRVLKKTPSLSSLNKKRLPPTQASSPSSESPVDAHKVPRRQRSHHRLPIPPISLGLKHSHATSVSTPPSPQTSEPFITFSTLEQRHASISSNASVSIPVRKRVFSGSSLRRPSTSSGIHHTPKEDDARSLFSLRSDHDVPAHTPQFKPWPTSISALASFSDDHPPLSPVRSDYTPQRIMSPEDLAKVEAELDDISIVSPLPPPTVPLPSIRQRTSSASTVFSDRDSEIIPPSIFSLPLSDSLASPQLSATKSPKVGSILISIPSEAGTSNGRSPSVVSKSSIAPPRGGHRPATSSGTTSGAPMLTKREGEVSRPTTASGDASTVPDTQPSPISPITPLNIKKAPRKNSSSSTNPPLAQMKSLPPPPRPRAKAEVVTVTDSRRNLPPKLPSEAGKRTSIGVDFGHGHRYGHVVSPSVQSMNNGFSTTSSATVSGGNQSPSRPSPNSSHLSPAPHHVPPVPPRAGSRPPPPSYRKPRVPVGGPQRQPSTGGGSKTSSRRMSLHRKPSFLEIDDDDDDTEPGANLDFDAIMRMSSVSSGTSFSRSDYASESFLEFGRESFDTVRSAEFGH